MNYNGLIRTMEDKGYSFDTSQGKLIMIIPRNKGNLPRPSSEEMNQLREHKAAIIQFLLYRSLSHAIDRLAEAYEPTLQFTGDFMIKRMEIEKMVLEDIGRIPSTRDVEFSEIELAC